MAGASINKEEKYAICKAMVSHHTLSPAVKGTMPLTLQSPLQLLSGITLGVNLTLQWAAEGIHKSNNSNKFSFILWPSWTANFQLPEGRERFCSFFHLCQSCISSNWATHLCWFWCQIIELGPLTNMENNYIFFAAIVFGHFSKLNQLKVWSEWESVQGKTSSLFWQLQTVESAQGLI